MHTNWNGFVPRKFRIILNNCLLDRRYRICSSYETICEKLEQIKTMLSRNSYPKGVLDKCIHEVFNR